MLRIQHALLADYAMVSQDGKLSIIGIFERIFAMKCPVTHPHMCLVLSFEADSADAGKKQKLAFQLIDADGALQLDFGGDLVVASTPSGDVARFNHIVNLNGVVIKEFGSYQFKILINGEVCASIPLKVSESKQASAGGFPPQPPMPNN